MKVTVHRIKKCILCQKTEEFLLQNSINHEVIIHNSLDYEEIFSKTKWYQFPIIFIDDKFIGGYFELVEKYNIGKINNIFESEF